VLRLLQEREKALKRKEEEFKQKEEERRQEREREREKTQRERERERELERERENANLPAERQCEEEVESVTMALKEKESTLHGLKQNIMQQQLRLSRMHCKRQKKLAGVTHLMDERIGRLMAHVPQQQLRNEEKG